ncbi:Uu.00g109910.m01.CDS01 [Anthostomella pinea]|uniref:Uu.00g109910.m01.CDS01 n=1 Tax=Anthostomella pinea TaxID=933095 RepID=A0AAI8YDT3_9PEZI|nr:Uu.00g109910.m01.CDS01 [Anthostomella pinea]
MAGHERSGYMSSLWHSLRQVLFVPFIQLLTRIFHFADPKKDPTPTPESQHHHHCSPSPSTTQHRNEPDLSTPLLHPTHTNHFAYHAADPDSELAVGDYSSQDDTMAASKKRGGRGRGGPRTTVAAGTEATAATNPAPAAVGQSNGVSAAPHSNAGQSSAPPSAPQTTAPAGVTITPLTNQCDTNTNSFQSGGQKRPGSRRGGRNRGRSSPTKHIVDNKKENAPPPQDDNGASLRSLRAAQTSSPALIAATENKGQLQKPGTRGQGVTKPQAAPAITKSAAPAITKPTVPAITKPAAPAITKPAAPAITNPAAPKFTPVNDESVAPDDQADQADQVEQLCTVADRLTIADAASAEQPAEQDLNIATAAVETAALPVPVVVAIPLPTQLSVVDLTEAPAAPILPGLIEPKTDEERAEREYHLTYMREALDMGVLALNTNETPVGCVLVYHGRTIAKGMNATNVTRNGTRHAEFMALSALLSRKEQGDVGEVNTSPNKALDDASWGDVDPKDGHIYPYGQKLHPAPVVTHDIISECVLYVTVEPCVMCASLLRQLGIRKVYFGAVNDKFGGTGGVFRIHMNSKLVPKPDNGRPYQNGYGPQDAMRIAKGRINPNTRDDDDGDGGNVEPGYPVEGGYLRDDAVSLLRRFYVQENGRAPQPRKKEGRAARLYAQEKKIDGVELSDEAITANNDSSNDTTDD